MFDIKDCENCLYYEFDDAFESYICTVYMDEDEMARYVQYKNKRCPYFKSGDEYQVVKKQM